MDLQAKIGQASALQKQGRLAEAEQSCREILQVAPQTAPAQHLLSMVLAEQGRAPEALAIYDQLLAEDPGNAKLWLYRAILLRRLERFDDALASCDKALAIDPGNAPAWSLRGAVLRKQDRLDEALESYDQALTFDPQDFVTRNNRGNLERALGRFEAALADYNACLGLYPRDAQILVNRGRLFLDDLARPGEALADFEAALAAQPGHAEALRGASLARNRIGAALMQEARAEEALAAFASVLAKDPANAEALGNRGMALRQLKRHGEALASFDAVLAKDAFNVGALHNRGVTLMEMNCPDEALEAFDSGLMAAPGHAELLYNRGNVLSSLKRPAEAAADFAAVLTVDRSHRFAFSALAGAVLALCDWPRVANIAPQLGRRIRERDNIVSPMTLAAYSDDPALLRDGARLALRERVPHVLPPLWQGPAASRTKIRIAYISADFRSHAVAAQLVDLIERHDRKCFEIIGIALNDGDGSVLRARLEAGFDEFHTVAHVSDVAAARLLQELRIDIAVDLQGHGEGARLGILAHRPCAVQVTWLGYPGTTAADFMDYVIGDPQVTPFAHQPWFSEQIIQMPLTYMPSDSRRPLPPMPAARAAFGLPDEGFVFCGLNNNWKIGAPVFDVWMRLLRRVPGSVLMLRRDSAEAGEALMQEAAVRGIDPARLIFSGYVATQDEHIARLQQADLFLDTIPYNAHATACDALWAGVPVLTCQGRAFAGRVAAGILTAAGLEELITDNLEAYEALALALARDPARLTALKRKLADGRFTMKLFDTDRFRRDIEAAYTRMIETARAGQAPRGFAVAES